MIKAVLFDWGNTLMIDFADQNGPMYSWHKIEAMKNAEDCLSSISEKYPCYIATNAKDSTKEDIYIALNIVNLGKYIKDIFCFKEIGYEKPSQEFYTIIFKKLCLKPEELILIGDDIEKDYYGANNIGIKGILFDPKLKSPEIKDRITDLLELKKYL